MTKKQLTVIAAEKAAKVLGIELKGLNAFDVATAYRKALRAVHPDVNSVPGQNASERIAQLQGARSVLLEWIDMQPDDDCATCRGTGSVRAGRFGSKPCPKCYP